jgi:hypothetical protein
MLDRPFMLSQNEVLKGCSPRVHSMEVSSIQAGEMQASTNPRKNLMAKKPEKLNTAAWSMHIAPQTNSIPPTNRPMGSFWRARFDGYAPQSQPK